MMPLSLGGTKDMVQEMKSGPSSEKQIRFRYATGIPLQTAYGDAAAVGVAAGSSPGVVAGILPAFTSAGNFTLGLLISANVTPASIFVSPITGGSPFFTNSHKPIAPSACSSCLGPLQQHISPGSLFPANLNASLTTCSCISPLSSKIIWLTAILAAQ